MSRQSAFNSGPIGCIDRLLFAAQKISDESLVATDAQGERGRIKVRALREQFAQTSSPEIRLI